MVALTPGLVAACTIGSALFAGSDGPVGLRLETAVTAPQRERGLMERAQLGPRSGMIFVFAAPQTVYFWMKNTPLALDMLFLGPRGTILGVHAKAQPEDRTIIASPGGTQYVVEIAGGTAASLGLMSNVALTDWRCAK
ncbi:MAG: DUF192 domain-containing protein [Paracoccaceae bacterium]|nr:DUF192 domain-containing protein [Paracoccaceae bacterium]